MVVVSSQSLYVPLPTVLLQVVSEDKLYPEEVRQSWLIIIVSEAKYTAKWLSESERFSAISEVGLQHELWFLTTYNDLA